MVPVATCMNITQPYLESNITYPNFSQYTGLNSVASGSGSISGTATVSGGAALVTQSGSKSAASSILSVGTIFCAGFVALISALYML